MSATRTGSPLSDPDRLAALRQSGLLDTPAEEAFDRLTRLASRMLDVPVALVSLVDENRQFFKSCIGLGEPWGSRREMPISYSFCQHALGSPEPLVIEDTREHPLVRDSPAVTEENAIAYAGVPLVSSGRIMGTFCVVDTRPRRWAEREIEFLREMAASVMTEVELRSEIVERRRAQSLLTAEQRVLERIGRGEPLHQVLEALALAIEEQMEMGLCSVHLLDPETRSLHLATAPHLPLAFINAIEGLPIGESVGSCGTAAFRNEPVIVSDTQSDPLWHDYRDLARDHGLIASWAHPIRDIDGRVLGTFAIYHAEVRSPGRDERHVVERAAYLAAIAIGRADRDEKIQQARAGATETLALLQSVIEGITDPIFAKDLNGRYTLANSALGSLVGRTADGVLGRTDSEFFPREVAVELRNVEDAVLQTAQSRTVEDWLDRADGESRFYLITKAPRRDAQGNVVGTLGIARDITDRKRAEVVLRQSEASYRSLFDSLQELVYILDLDETLLAVNEAVLRQYGYTRHEVLSGGATLLGDPDLTPISEIREHWSQVLQGKTPRFESWGRTKAGKSFLQEVTFAKGEYFGAPVVIAVARDITERKEAEAALQESEERFRQVAENISSVFWLYDLVGQRSLYVSPAYERIWGRPREPVYLDPLAWMEHIHPEDREKVRPASLEAVQTNYASEYRIIRPGGEVRTILDRGFPVRNDRGEVIRVAGIAEDITPLVEAGRKLSEREGHYRRLVTTAPAGIYALDTEGRFVELNPAGEEILERKAAGVLGEHFATVVFPEDLPIAERVFTNILSGLEAKVGFELRIVRPSGEFRLLQFSAAGVTEGDRIIGLHGIARDITEERARERVMRLLTAALESLDEGVSLCTSELKILYSNAAWARILGLDARHLEAFDPRNHLPDESAREQFREIQSALQDTGYWSGRVWRRRGSDGQVIPLDLIAGESRAPSGERNLFFILHDASAAIERENQLRRVERLASLGTLIGGVAHELNNPLHAIRNFAELMLLEHRNADDRESLEIVKREADRAAKVVSDLRLVARSTQEEKSQRASVDLNDVVRHVLKLRRYTLETANVEIREDLTSDMPPVRANRGELEQVVLNLIVNAEQAMAGQTDPQRLIVRTRQTRRGASVHVVDTGPGIPVENFDRIFDPFFTTKGPGEGTGLGLSLVHSIVSEHGGEIEVESEPGKGTAFRIDLPLAPAGEERVSREESTVSTPSRSLRILVVDDEEAIRRVTARFLERRGHLVDSAQDGGEALRLLQGVDYDVIVSDLRMAGLGGADLFRQLREEGRGREQRLVFITGDAASGQSARFGFESDMPILIKPVRLEDLARAVENAGEANSSAG